MIYKEFVIAIQEYIEITLGITDVKIEEYLGTEQIPYLFQDQFYFYQMLLRQQRIILVWPKQHDMTIRQIRDSIEHMSLKDPVVICFEVLASYERRYLIEKKVSFIVPGNQMYLLDLGIDLREYFPRKKNTHLKSINPATQAMLLWFLMNNQYKNEWCPSEVASVLDYAGMTSTRACNELLEIGLFESFKVGRKNYLRLLDNHQNTWEKAKPYLKSPVKQKIWVKEKINLSQGQAYLAGITALSKMTMINSESETCYAITAQQWHDHKNLVRILPEEEPGAICYQIWTYETKMYQEKTTEKSIKNSQLVDVLSLWLSFQDSTDVRIQMVLDELGKDIKW